MEELNSGLPPLEEPCTGCGGTGDSPPPKYGEIRASLNCSTCKGHKVMPTEAGRQIIEFISRRFEISEREAHRSMFG